MTIPASIEDGPIVSSEAEELILVDDTDAPAGHLSKAAAHDGDGVLHRAFSVFLFNEDGQLLLQQRAAGKRLWPGYWSNSCCSHPRRGETMQVATERRLLDELGVTSQLEYIYKFTYHARFRELGSERELCHVFLGRISSDVRANGTEIAAMRFVDPSTLADALERDDERYTPWFKLEWQALTGEHADRLEPYLQAGP